MKTLSLSLPPPPPPLSLSLSLSLSHVRPVDQTARPYQEEITRIVMWRIELHMGGGGVC